MRSYHCSWRRQTSCVARLGLSPHALPQTCTKQEADARSRWSISTPETAPGYQSAASNHDHDVYRHSGRAPWGTPIFRRSGRIYQSSHTVQQRGYAALLLLAGRAPIISVLHHTSLIASPISHARRLGRTPAARSVDGAYFATAFSQSGSAVADRHET